MPKWFWKSPKRFARKPSQKFRQASLITVSHSRVRLCAGIHEEGEPIGDFGKSWRNVPNAAKPDQYAGPRSQRTWVRKSAKAGVLEKVAAGVDWA